ncbi:hypothetical protein ACO0LF_25275 [Undibacterium sp. Di27W]|uniref:hypothetical protein n=1 Tax=Undibacterium sp. Di27W TaxID=3413036 RepID=UPI003BF16FD6
MELSEFIDLTLTQILSGIRAAQEREEVGAYIVADFDGGHEYAQHPRFSNASRLKSTIVDFDIAVTAEDSSKKGASGALTVFGIGGKIEGDVASKETHVSRIQFAVPILLPKANRPWHSEKKSD